MRAIWSGSLAFGLINIPVRIYSASEERALKFKLLDKHGHCPISYAKVCRGTNKEVKYEDIVKGYEYQKGDFVILTDEDFKKAAPKKTKAIEIVSFTEESEVETKYINKPYFIEPDSKAEKAYVLLREALKKSKKAGIARYVFKDKEHIGLVKPEGNALMLIELRFQDELRTPEDLKIPDKAEYTKKELDIALMLINQLEEHFNVAQYHDTYTEALKKVIEKKAEGRPIKVPEDAEPVPTDMKNLMSMLKASLEQAKK
jgi:DNA end-binding protein Ku